MMLLRAHLLTVPVGVGELLLLTQLSLSARPAVRLSVLDEISAEQDISM